MKPSLRVVRTVLSLSISTVLVTGCGNLGDTLRLRRTVLVKVPIEKPIPNASTRNGWEFRHVLEAPKDRANRGQWYVAWNNRAPIESTKSSQFWRMLFARAPEIAGAVKSAFGEYPLLIEPNLSFRSRPAMAPMKDEPGRFRDMRLGAGVRLEPNLPRSKAWPVGRVADEKDRTNSAVDPMWHFGDAHSEFTKAHKRIPRPGDGIKIGHLDNGFDARHPATPMNLERGEWRANAVGLLDYAQGNAGRPPAPEDSGGSHGMGTVGILAGNWVAFDAQEVKGERYKSYYGWLGGAPYAKVVPVRVAPWVVSFGTGELAYAIDHASRVRGCDVLTMSHGGSPTQAWVDAVNAAYDRGTAMFAAESDFFSLAFNPIKPRGFILPASPVYPAGFRRVIGVTGATSDQHSYARNSLGRLLGNLREFRNWAFRGSYGADGTNTSLLRPSDDPDPSSIRWLGKLRPHPIAAYAPNVPWLSLRKNKDGMPVADGVDLDGSGTSAATPQVAAAAALWLQKNRAELIRRGWWNDWHKAETVYHALLYSADRGGRKKPDNYLGAGLLKADRALDVTLAEIESHTRPKKGVKDPAGDSLYFDPKHRAPRDYFDGVRSLPGLLGVRFGGEVPIGRRATLRQNETAAATQPEAMQRLYYNMLLLRSWHSGGVPRKDDRKDGKITRERDESRYWERAGRMAADAGAKARP